MRPEITPSTLVLKDFACKKKCVRFSCESSYGYTYSKQEYDRKCFTHDLSKRKNYDAGAARSSAKRQRVTSTTDIHVVPEGTWADAFLSMGTDLSIWSGS
eukprot:CAMPEP_0185024892 /NCGR_PEP_ID=MMETSP1103-20130426/8064_1 /TAXON_ID=36769 /ORGANISM="Paraphysomonas bandaiensis, Strain Caron Lab Isolate" /LENGTH=99 /DNA_ID=CAMNT_0027557971 /DNA_START=164 /DNA_END=463 /DNA_ORIENTATION=-